MDAMAMIYDTIYSRTESLVMGIVHLVEDTGEQLSPILETSQKSLIRLCQRASAALLMHRCNALMSHNSPWPQANTPS